MDWFLFFKESIVLDFFNEYGGLWLGVLTFAFFLMMIFWVLDRRAFKKYRRDHLMLLEGIHIANIEEFILKQDQEVGLLRKEVEMLRKEVRILEEIQLLAIQKMGLVRYDPFKDLGGELSFSLALLDGRDDGLIITCIHGREEARLFTKPLIRGKTRYPLSEEELLAIEKAKNNKENELVLLEGGGGEQS